jgi:uncharacterized protein (TIGR01777 family)
MNAKHPYSSTKKGSSVLITGGSGLVGRYLTSLLLEKGYHVSHLSRKTNQFGKVRVFRWDPDKEILDPVVFEGIDYVIHLAGANIGEKRWTKNRKDEIVKSRVDSALFLNKVISNAGITLKAFISASAVGYYGSVVSENIFSENDPAGEDFLGVTCSHWEEAADLFGKMGVRTVKIRTAVVLEKSDNALTKLMIPAKFGFMVATGSGRQYLPWIHISDLSNIYLKAIEDSSMNGAYNAVSPHYITHMEFVKTLAHIIGKPVLPFTIPAFFLQAAFGKMSDIILKGSRISAEKIMNSGFSFRFSNLEDALTNVISA